MLPLFKSHYSIGKSILTLDNPNSVKEGGPQSIFSIAKDLKTIILVEDSLIGFLQAQKNAENLGMQLVFGLRISCSHEKASDKPSDCNHKIVIFAKTDKGCQLLNKIYSKAYCENEGVVINDDLKKFWSEEDLMLAIPFYDSFIYMNNYHFCSCVPDFSFCSPTFLIENNFLPFDFDLKSKVLDYCSANGYQHENAKSIYYSKKEDFAAYQTYKCICSKKFKQRTLNVPNFDHLASPEFCYESYLENERS